jgi:PAS domain S-box-containing protein
MPHPIQVPSEIIQKWQGVVDLLAEIIQVPSALIMRAEPPNIKVFVSSESNGNPYEPEEVASLNTGLYCETVMKTRQPLLVPDALRDDEWKSNPDIKLGMISYLGFPISWPDGEIFGTICLLDNKRNEYSDLYRKLLLQWRDVLQADLRSVATLHGELEEREAKIRRLVDANIIGVLISDLEGQIIEANDAFLDMVGYTRDDVASRRLRWTEMTPAEWHAADERAAAQVRTTGACEVFEKEYFRKDGSRVPVLVGAAAAGRTQSESIAFVLDQTERKRAEEAMRQMEMELAHANRVATISQLTASIAHEVRQPIGAAVTNAQAALRWLERQPPDLEEVRLALGRIVETGHRASDVVDRTRALIKKAPPRTDCLDINLAVRDVIELTRGEAVKNGVSVQTDLADGLPLSVGDRVQLQQVILNLTMNAIEAMSSASNGMRELLISTRKVEPGGVIVVVRDSGPGLAPAALEHLFNPFYTTKPDGLGLGLSICRSIIEAHGGSLRATANVPRGAAFEFTLPADARGTS